MADHHHHHHQNDASINIKSRGSSTSQSGLQNQILKTSASSLSASSLSSSMEPSINPEKNKMGSFIFNLNLPLKEEEEEEAMEEECNERNEVGGPDEEDKEEENKKKRKRFGPPLELVRISSGDDGRSEPTDLTDLLLSLSLRDNNNTICSTTTTDHHELTTGTGSEIRPLPDQENEEKRKEKKNAEEEKEAALAVAEEAASSPALKRRSWRTQVLAHKYRDSVVEPTLWPRHNRPSSAHSRNKRRSPR